MPSKASPQIRLMAAIRQNTARTAIALAFALACIALGSAQDFVGAPGAAANLFPKPERPVAGIVSPIWHDEKERDDAGEIQQLVQLLGIKPGMTVADIGSGSGYYVVQLAPIVGPDGRIFAEDITPDYLRNLRKRVRDLGLQNVTLVRGEPHDPRLPADSLDVAILVHMYHEITQPYGLLYNLVIALKPGARIGIVDALGPSRSTAPRQSSCAASSRPSAIARSAFTRLRAAMPTWRSRPRRPTTPAHARKRSPRAARSSSSEPGLLGLISRQLDGVEPAEAGHEHGEHHHIESRARECLDSLRTILGKDDVKAFAFEPASK